MNLTYISKPISEYWFVPIDIIRIIIGSLLILIFLVYLSIIIFDKTCHNVPMILFVNTCISAVINGCYAIWMCTFSLENDLKQIHYEDRFCVFRGYLFYVIATACNLSYTIQALYRYMTAVYPTYRYWQTKQCQFILIIATWLFSIIHPFAFLFTNDIIYNVDNQICQFPLKLSFPLIFEISCGYIIPVLLIMSFYIKLVLYVRQTREHGLQRNTLIHAQRELRMIKRMIIIISILFFLGVPYTIFILISFFTSSPKYHFRIAFLFIDVGLFILAIVSYQVTDPLKTAVMKLLKRRSNVIASTIP